MARAVAGEASHWCNVHTTNSSKFQTKEDHKATLLNRVEPIAHARNREY